MTVNPGTKAAGSMLGLARSLSAGWWLLAIAITSGTNLLDFFAAAQPNAARSPFFAVAAIIRILLVFWLGYALIRRLAGQAEPAKITVAFLRFALFMLAMVIVLAVATGVAVAVTRSSADSAAAGVVAFLLVTLIMILLIRLYAWQAALALGDRTLGPAGAWRNLTGATGGLIGAYLIVAVVAALHGVLTRMAIASTDSSGTLAVLAVLDGLVSSAQLVLSCALAVVAYRTASSRGEALREGAAVA